MLNLWGYKMDRESTQFLENINKDYYKKTSNRLLLREFNGIWYVCELVPLGERTLSSGSLAECKQFINNSV